MKLSTYKAFLILMALFLAFTTTGFAQLCTESGSIVKVKNRQVGKTEYVIFDLKKGGEYEPKWDVTKVSGPFTDYSGDTPIEVKGSKYMKIAFRSFNWMCEIPMKTRTPKRAVKDVKKLWAFEGIAEFVIGTSARARYITTYSYDAGSRTKVVMKFRR